MLLDTSAYSEPARGKQSIIAALAEVTEIGMPLPTVAELRFGFAEGSQTARNEQQLQRSITTGHYAKLQLLCQQKGKALSQNDIWIASLALETSQNLVTFDQDFAVFRELFGKQLTILS